MKRIIRNRRLTPEEAHWRTSETYSTAPSTCPRLIASGRPSAS